MLPRFIPMNQTRARLSLLLICALTLTTLSGLPVRATHASVKTGDERQEQVQIVTNNYRQTNFVSDIPGAAFIQDPLLVNPWGIAMSAASPFWTSNNGTSTATLYGGDVSGSPLSKVALNVTIPCGLPTGIVFSGSATDFTINNGSSNVPARFIFDSITGRVTAWTNGLTTAKVAFPVPSPSPADPCGTPPPPPIYTGLAIGNNGTANFLYVANFADFTGGRIVVFDKSFAVTTLAGSFTDPTIPSNFHPFNIQNIGGKLYVAYAKVDPSTGRDLPGPGNGYVSVFDTNGNFLSRLVSNGPLSSPWGLVIAPAGFGVFPGALLVGNFGDGRINAFNPTTGAFLGTLNDEAGNPIEIDELWALTFGNGVGAGDTSTLYFTAGTGEEEHGIFGSLKPSSPATSIAQFSASNPVSVSEGAGSVTITVTRAGDLTGSATVRYASFDKSPSGHANQKSDYEIAEGILRFAPGEASKTFKILLIDDKFVEGDEKINLMLSNPSGVALGSPSNIEVTINDNDTSPSTTNPIDNTDFFVRQQYLDFLNREPEAGQPWTGILNGCADPKNNDPNSPSAKCDRVTVSESFFLSAEYQVRGYFATRFYRAAFGRDPLYGEFMGDMSRLSAGDEASKATFASEFTQRPEFVVTYGTLTNAQYVDKLIANTGVAASSYPTGFRDSEVAALDASTKTRAQVLRDIVEQPAFASDVTTFNRAFILAEYFGYLRRDPDTAGLSAWIAYLTAHPGDFRTMVHGFVNSNEYRQRFGAS
jgi:uncharacterized protein (TIGR03118 family)